MLPFCLGRSQHVRLLCSWLFPLPVQNSIWVWGATGTGKSEVLRRVFSVDSTRNERVAFVNCGSVVSPSKTGRVLFETVLNQLAKHEMCAPHYKPFKSCATADTFEQLLLALVRDEQITQPLYVVFEGAEALVEGLEAVELAWLVRWARDFPHPIGVVFVARTDWRHCGRGVWSALTDEPMHLHFGDYTDEERVQILVEKGNSDPQVVGRGEFSLGKQDFWKSWVEYLVKTTSVMTGPLFGLSNLYSFAKDGFPHFYKKVKPRGKADASLFEAIQPFIQARLSQRAENLFQPAQRPFATPAKSAEKRLNPRELAREKRMRVLEPSPTSASLPKHDAALVVAGFFASLVPKERDTQLFSEKNVRKKLRKSMSTGSVAPTIASERQHQQRAAYAFSLQRLLNIFRHVIGNEEFQPNAMWHASVASLLNAGYFEKKHATANSAKGEVKLKSVTDQALAQRLAQEIGYDGFHAVLESYV